MPDVGLRQVEAERRQPRPCLLDEIKEAPGAAADVDKPQFALVASGESFRKRRQRLPPHGVGRSLEQHLDLRVVAVGGFLSQPAARLEMEILQVVVRAPAARLCVQHLVRRVALAALVDLGEVAEEQPRAVEQREQRAVMVRGKGIDPGLDVGEILLEQRRPVGVQALLDAWIGSRLRRARSPPSCCRTCSASRRMT